MENKIIKQLTFRARRGLLDSELQKKYYNLVKGIQGENKVVQMIRDFGDPKWELIRNYWFFHERLSECDLLFITQESLHVIEVKNYDGEVNFTKGSLYVNGKYRNNILSIFAERLKGLEDIFANTVPPINISGILIFANEHCNFITDDIHPFTILQPNQIRSYFRNLKHESQLASPDFQEKILSKLKEKACKAPEEDFSLTDLEWEQMTKGILCKKCHQNQIELKYLTIKCQKCGQVEGKNSAIARGIDEMLMLFANRKHSISCQKICQLLGNTINMRTIYKFLVKNSPTLNEK